MDYLASAIVTYNAHMGSPDWAIMAHLGFLHFMGDFVTEPDNVSMRKPKLTYKLVEQAVELKSHGLSNVDICNALDITEGTFYRWLREDDTKLKRALKQGLKKSEAEYKDQLLQKIEAAADKPQHWTAAAWILERKYPDEFGKAERTRDDKSDDVPHISLGVEVKVTNEGDGDV